MRKMLLYFEIGLAAYCGLGFAAAAAAAAAEPGTPVLEFEQRKPWLTRALSVEGVIGPGYLVEPFCEGSASVRSTFWPIVDITINQRVHVNADDGIDVAFWRSPKFESGPRAWYSWGR